MYVHWKTMCGWLYIQILWFFIQANTRSSFPLKSNYSRKWFLYEESKLFIKKRNLRNSNDEIFEIIPNIIVFSVSSKIYFIYLYLLTYSKSFSIVTGASQLVLCSEKSRPRLERKLLILIISFLLFFHVNGLPLQHPN